MGSEELRPSPELELVEDVEAQESTENNSETEEETAEPLPVIDEDGVVHLTRTTKKGG